MSFLRMIYLVLAVLGLAQYALLAVQTGSSLVAWQLIWEVRLEPLYADNTGEGSPLAFEYWVAVLALTVWVLAETWVRKNWLVLVVIPVAVLVGLGCALPLYLFLRTRPVM